MEELKFPVGRFVWPELINHEMMEVYKATIQHFPDLLEAKLKKVENVHRLKFIASKR